MVIAIPASFPRSVPQAAPHYEGCGSANIVKNTEGYAVCRACNLVQEEVPFVVSDPLSRDHGILSSHAVRAGGMGTLVGSRAEQEQTNPALQRAVRVSGPSFFDAVMQRAYFAMRKVMCLARLEGQGAIFGGTLRLFKQYYHVLPHGSRARNVDALAIVAVYRAAGEAGFFVFRSRTIPLQSPKNLSSPPDSLIGHLSIIAI